MKRSAVCALFICSVAQSLPAATISGRVVQGDQGLEGMTVTAHRTVDPSAPAVATARSGADGSYRMEVADGRYSLFARDEDGRLFALCGRNPVEAAGPEPVWAGLQAVPSSQADYGPYDDSLSGAVEGRVFLDSQPLAGAVATLYLDAKEDLKGQGYRIAPPTAEDGVFAFDALPEAGYHLVVRRRESGGRVGPILDGDALAIYSGNPLPVFAGKTARILLHAVRKPKETTGDETFSRKSGLFVQGVIVDAQGKPQAGLHAFAYTDKVIGHKRPEAISAPTGKDGRFTMTFPAAGLYYVGARRDYGDSPAPGEFFGLYDATADHGLQVDGKDAGEIRIVVEPISID